LDNIDSEFRRGGKDRGLKASGTLARHAHDGIIQLEEEMIWSRGKIQVSSWRREEHERGGERKESV